MKVEIDISTAEDYRNFAEGNYLIAKAFWYPMFAVGTMFGAALALLKLVETFA